MCSDAARAHDALVESWGRLTSAFDDASFERRGDLILALCPSLPIPQCNGPWVVEDSDAAVAALPGAVAEVEQAGARPCVQTRSGHERTRAAARELGLTHEERIPGMILQPGELEAAAAVLEITPIRPGEADEANEILAVSFEAPLEIFERFSTAFGKVAGASWYVGRSGNRIVSTAVGFTVDRVTGVFNVATPPAHRGRGYAAALTERVVRDGFAAGSELAYLQSSSAGHGVYLGLGFRDVEEYTLLTRPSGAQKP